MNRAWTTREWLALGAVGAVLVLGSIGLALRHARSATPSFKASLIEPESVTVAAKGDGDSETNKEVTPSPTPKATPRLMVVHVTGAVKRPGVYTLHAGDRLYHAIRAAGGFKASAQQDALNLADTVRDADQINVPARAELARVEAVAVARHVSSAPRTTFTEFRKTMASAPPLVRATPYAVVLDKPKDEPIRGRVLGVAPVPIVNPISPAASLPKASTSTAPPAEKALPTSSSSASEKFKNPGDGTINLNTATASDLEHLPGVGPSTSARILEYRQQIGRFSEAKQLMDVKGIGEKKFAKMAPFITL